MGGSSDLERRWALAIQRLLPSAEKVRFTSSGTEATMMAVRLARAATGRDRLLRLTNHFHGWNDSVFAAGRTSAGAVAANGQPEVMQGLLSVFDQTDVTGIAAALASKEFAALIMEPTGYSWGTCPLDPSVAQEVRDLTERHGTLLIFDEVVTGFRASAGGAQERIGVRPDLTTLAKIAAGGLPGGAVVGTRGSVRPNQLRRWWWTCGASGNVQCQSTLGCRRRTSAAGRRRRGSDSRWQMNAPLSCLRA